MRQSDKWLSGLRRLRLPAAHSMWNLIDEWRQRNAAMDVIVVLLTRSGALTVVKSCGQFTSVVLYRFNRQDIAKIRMTLHRWKKRGCGISKTATTCARGCAIYISADWSRENHRNRAWQSRARAAHHSDATPGRCKPSMSRVAGRNNCCAVTLLHPSRR